MTADAATEHPGLGLRIGPDDDPDRYELISLEGGGAEGLVYRARLDDGVLTHDVAVKVVSYVAADDWRHQIELLRSVAHPAIVAVREGFEARPPHAADQVGSEPRQPVIVMNWVDGVPLDEAIRSGRIAPEEAFIRLLDVATALDLLHSGDRTGGVPIVHRDVKPANIMITPAGTGVLVDFGISTTAGATTSAGTPSFRAPEWARGDASPSLDAYGLGATAAFVLLEGATPSPAPEQLQQQLARSTVAALRPNAVARVAALCSREPEDRPTQLAAELRSVAEGTEWRTASSRTAVPSSDGRDPGRATPRRRWRLAGLVGLGVVVSVSGLVVATTRGGTGDPAPVEGGCDAAALATDAAAAGLVWADPDADCLTTGYEIDVLGSDPEHPDTDGDGLIDGLDPSTCSGCVGIPPVEVQADPFGE
ncbi:MAG: serine/threonine-protein kinase [Actinomycetota bacterium]